MVFVKCINKIITHTHEYGHVRDVAHKHESYDSNMLNLYIIMI